MLPKIRSTTVLGVRHNGQIALGADGQATMDKHVAKNNVRKVRQLNDGKVVTGFAGSTADAFMLLDRFEEKLAAYGNNLKRAAIELAKDWRKDQYLRKLEAMMVWPIKTSYSSSVALAMCWNRIPTWPLSARARCMRSRPPWRSRSTLRTSRPARW